MKTQIVYVERKASEAVSIEKVFRQIAKSLPANEFNAFFSQLKYPNDLLGTIKNLILFRKKKADIYHVTGHIHYIALVMPKNKTILTIHDAGILHIRNGLRRFILKKLLFDLPIRRLKYITAVSEATKREVLNFTNCAPDKIRVIENPVQEHFYSNQKKSFNDKCPNILQIGTTANKNICNLIKALEGINCQLTIVGKLPDKDKRILDGSKIRYSIKQNLDNKQVREEYANADIVSFCSTFEGFGLPIIEAQAMRTPVITSNISPMREVAGGGAALVEPEKYESIRRGILRLIDDENYRIELVLKGIENVKKYKSENIAEIYINLYRQVITSKT